MIDKVKAAKLVAHVRENYPYDPILKAVADELDEYWKPTAKEVAWDQYISASVEYIKNPTREGYAKMTALHKTYQTIGE
jgi:hypothetical protein